MKTFEETFVEEVMSNFQGVYLFPDAYHGGQRGGIPDFFYETSQDVFRLTKKRPRRSKQEIAEEDDMESEEIEERVLFKLGLIDDTNNRFLLRKVEMYINRADDTFIRLLKRYREAGNAVEREVVCRGAIDEIRRCIRGGCNSPEHFFFLRRFGIYG